MEVGEEFAALDEQERCDLVFAMGAINEESSNDLLLRALGDPSQTVALAAAHALARNGRQAEVKRRLEAEERRGSKDLMRLLGLMTESA